MLQTPLRMSTFQRCQFWYNLGIFSGPEVHPSTIHPSTSSTTHGLELIYNFSPATWFVLVSVGCWMFFITRPDARESYINVFRLILLQPVAVVSSRDCFSNLKHKHRDRVCVWVLGGFLLKGLLWAKLENKVKFFIVRTANWNEQTAPKPRRNFRHLISAQWSYAVAAEAEIKRLFCFWPTNFVTF